MYDEHYHEYLQEQMHADLYEEFKDQAVEEFTIECLRSYYLANRCLAKPAVESLAAARDLIAKNVTAGFIFSTIAIEVGLKSTLLKPIVNGLVQTSSIAEPIAELLFRNAPDRLQDLTFGILKEHGEVDLREYKRPKSDKTVWREITDLQKLRNGVMHRAEMVPRAQAESSVCVGSVILETFFPQISKGMNLHLHEGYRICDDSRCEYQDILDRLAK